MSEATRCVAIQEAVKVRIAGGVFDPAAIVIAAGIFDDFINGTKTTAAAETKPAAEKAAKPTPVKTPVKAKPSAEDTAATQIQQRPAEDDESDPVVPAITKESVTAAITALIQAGARDRAVALLGEYNANSVGKLKESDYATVLSKAEAIAEEVALAS